MTSKICSIGDCPRTVHNGGMCRPHREQHLHGTRHPGIHTVGEARRRLEELVEYYGSVGTAAKAIRIGRGTITRVLTMSGHEPLKVTSFNRIMDHEPVNVDAVDAPVTRAVVAEYATTPEGRAFIEKCWSPKPKQVAA